MIPPAGPLLGVIKAMTAYISGEMHDTAELGALESKSTTLFSGACVNVAVWSTRLSDVPGGLTPRDLHLICLFVSLSDILWGRDSNVFNKKQRVQLFRTWGSLSAMLPKGRPSPALLLLETTSISITREGVPLTLTLPFFSENSKAARPCGATRRTPPKMTRKTPRPCASPRPSRSPRDRPPTPPPPHPSPRDSRRVKPGRGGAAVRA